MSDEILYRSNLCRPLSLKSGIVIGLHMGVELCQNDKNNFKIIIPVSQFSPVYPSTHTQL